MAMSVTAAVEFSLPEVKAAGVGSGGAQTPRAGAPQSQTVFRSAVLDSSQMTELVEAMGDVLTAAGAVLCPIP